MQRWRGLIRSNNIISAHSFGSFVIICEKSERIFQHPLAVRSAEERHLYVRQPKMQNKLVMTFSSSRQALKLVHGQASPTRTGCSRKTKENTPKPRPAGARDVIDGLPPSVKTRHWKRGSCWVPTENHALSCMLMFPNCYWTHPKCIYIGGECSLDSVWIEVRGGLTPISTQCALGPKPYNTGMAIRPNHLDRWRHRVQGWHRAIWSKNGVSRPCDETIVKLSPQNWRKPTFHGCYAWILTVVRPWYTVTSSGPAQKLNTLRE